MSPRPVKRMSSAICLQPATSCKWRWKRQVLPHEMARLLGPQM